MSAGLNRYLSGASRLTNFKSLLPIYILQTQSGDIRTNRPIRQHASQPQIWVVKISLGLGIRVMFPGLDHKIFFINVLVSYYTHSYLYHICIIPLIAKFYICFVWFTITEHSTKMKTVVMVTTAALMLMLIVNTVSGMLLWVIQCRNTISAFVNFCILFILCLWSDLNNICFKLFFLVIPININSRFCYLNSIHVLRL